MCLVCTFSLSLSPVVFISAIFKILWKSMLTNIKPFIVHNLQIQTIYPKIFEWPFKEGDSNNNRLKWLHSILHIDLIFVFIPFVFFLSLFLSRLYSITDCNDKMSTHTKEFYQLLLALALSPIVIVLLYANIISYQKKTRIVSAKSDISNIFSHTYFFVLCSSSPAGIRCDVHTFQLNCTLFVRLFCNASHDQLIFNLLLSIGEYQTSVQMQK